MSILSLLAAAGIGVVSYRFRPLPVIVPVSTVVGWDTAADPVGEAGQARDARLPAGWIRLRGIGEIGEEAPRRSAQQADVIAANRHALETLRKQGYKLCIHLRWHKRPGATGSQANGRPYLPSDLRHAYGRSWWLGASYGDLVDAWEIDNEPDLGFVPELAENYAAYLKACWLGLESGIAENGAGRPGPKDSGPHGGRGAVSDGPATAKIRRPLVIMAALGLPPGPWLEHFSANDGFGYTDGFNYHYYGYADDFTAVYRQHERAVAQLLDESYQLLGSAADSSVSITNNKAARPTNNHWQRKELPIYLTEIGYGMLGKQARDTKEGRLRQWRWFRSVGEQIAALRPEAPMAFQVPPYLERETLEFGLTVRSAVVAGASDKEQVASDKWTAGGIEYRPEDFGTRSAESWMELIGKGIGDWEITPALAWWVEGRRVVGRSGIRSWQAGPSRNDSDLGPHVPVFPDQPRSWIVSAAPQSPLVLDFLPENDLQPVKRYLGTFVTGNVPPGVKPAEGASLLPPVVRPASPPKPSRSEEFMIHVRTANGNLYEVYPTRMATPDWQNYLESQGNFTMSFYGRAELPWRFKDNKPASLVMVMYPSSLPATYEFRRPQLIRLGDVNHGRAQKDTKGTEQGARSEELRAKSAVPNAIDEKSLTAERLPLTVLVRYGQGKVVLYNFSDKPVSGKLLLPEIFTADAANLTDGEQSVVSVQSVGKIAKPITLAPGERRPAVAEAMAGSSSPSTDLRAGEVALELQPGERRELNVIIKVPAERFERTEVTITFMPVDGAIPPARFVTEFFPALEGMKRTVVAELAKGEVHGERGMGRSTSPIPLSPSQARNREIVANRPLATEEAKGFLQPSAGWFAQQGAKVETTSEGFTVTVTETPPGKEQRVEVEIPWPDGLEFRAEEFLSLEFRIR